jgi:TRAP-type mannitol/chloroaromatic compound transport system substrate-binding protein
MIQPYARSRTERAAMQRDIRQWMGTSREGAQSTRTILHAASRMAALVKYATGGELTLALVKVATQEPVSFSEAVRDAAVDSTL